MKFAIFKKRNLKQHEQLKLSAGMEGQDLQKCQHGASFHS